MHHCHHTHTHTHSNIFNILSWVRCRPVVLHDPIRYSCINWSKHYCYDTSCHIQGGNSITSNAVSGPECTAISEWNWWWRADIYRIFLNHCTILKTLTYAHTLFIATTFAVVKPSEISTCWFNVWRSQTPDEAKQLWIEQSGRVPCYVSAQEFG